MEQKESLMKFVRKKQKENTLIMKLVVELCGHKCNNKTRFAFAKTVEIRCFVD